MHNDTNQELPHGSYVCTVASQHSVQPNLSISKVPSMKDMIRQLPASLQQLSLDNIEVMVLEYNITRCIHLQQPIRLASNGGVIPGRASYGWILQIGNAQVAKGKGPAYGDDPQSFLAEGYRMASALSYLSLLQQIIDFNCKIWSTNILSYDNEGLLDIHDIECYYMSRMGYQIGYTNHVQRTGPNFYIFLHVQSHQDDDTPAVNLSLESCLNV
jgi:hypothetical protein